MVTGVGIYRIADGKIAEGVVAGGPAWADAAARRDPVAGAPGAVSRYYLASCRRAANSPTMGDSSPKGALKLTYTDASFAYHGVPMAGVPLHLFGVPRTAEPARSEAPWRRLR
jgi:hypothetical protein